MHVRDSFTASKRHIDCTTIIEEIDERSGGISYTEVAKLVARTETEMKSNRGMKSRISRLDRKLSQVKGWPIS